MNKRIAVVGIVGIPAKYGGFETLVEYITREINQNFELTVYCSAKSYSNKLKKYNNCTLHYINLDANGLQSIFYDIRAIFHSLKFSDIILILGVSGGIILPIVKFFYEKKIIINIDGLEWKRQKWSWFVKMFLKLSERCAINAADAVIADNKVIQDYIKQTYGKKSYLISYGGDHSSSRPLSREILKKYPFLNAQYAFKVCRIEPENNIEIILEAFSHISNRTLVLIGNWNKSNFGIEIRSKYDSFCNIYLLDPIYDPIILDQIRGNCEIYVHGHSAGGTNPSLVEAMSLGLPTLCYDINYNVETTEGAALYFKSSEDLINLIKSTGKEELKNIGLKMKNIAHKRYTWSIISNQYKELFQKY